MIPILKVNRVKLLKANRGLLAAVARQEGVSGAFTSDVYHGLATSARIKAAIEREIAARIQGAVPRMERTAWNERP